jgi:hypothetical protein
VIAAARIGEWDRQSHLIELYRRSDALESQNGGRAGSKKMQVTATLN